MSLIDRQGRIVGWLGWARSRPMLDAVTRLSPLLGLMTCGCLSASPRSRFARCAGRPRDLTASEAEALRIANEDPLTGLPNRRKVLRSARPRAGRAAATEGVVCFAFLDLDGFKDVNEALGHQAGDELLVSVAERLRRATAGAGTLGRLGGDEFAVVVRADDAAAGDADRQDGDQGHDAAVLDRRPGAAGRPDRRSRARAARRREPRRTDPPRRSGAARRQAANARPRGRVRARPWRTNWTTAASSIASCAARWPRAASTSTTSRSSPPTASASSASRRCCAGTIRTRGDIPPARVRAGRRADRADAQARRVRAAPRARGCAALAGSSTSPSICRRCRCATALWSIWSRRCWRETGIDAVAGGARRSPKGVLIDNPDEAQARLEALRALGVRIALDDFGSGYSSLSYLQPLPVRQAQDRQASFVAPLGRSANGGVIIQAIMALGRALGLTRAGRGRRDRGAAHAAAAGRLRRDAGLPVRPAGVRRRRIDRLMAQSGADAAALRRRGEQRRLSADA